MAHHRHGAFAALLALGFVACDPVHSDAIDALGGEAPGVRTGPLHRAGQPCTTCHDGALGHPGEFAVAGTVFVDEGGQQAAAGATVTLTSSNGEVRATTANEAGNFYLTPTEFSPAYPMKVRVTYNGIDVMMTSEVGRVGSCGACHKNPAGPASAGYVFIPADGGTP